MLSPATTGLERARVTLVPETVTELIFLAIELTRTVKEAADGMMAASDKLKVISREDGVAF